MMIKPATTLNVSEFCKRTWPKYEAAAPKIIKTKEKPATIAVEEFKNLLLKNIK